MEAHHFYFLYYILDFDFIFSFSLQTLKYAMSRAGDQPQKAVPAQLGFLAIYNPSLGTTDETLEQQIVYYFSTESREGATILRNHVDPKCYRMLSENGKNEQLHSLQVALGCKRVFGSEHQHLHYWEKRPRGTCAWCSYMIRRQKALGKAVESKPKRIIRGCSFFKARGIVGHAFIQIM